MDFSSVKRIVLPESDYYMGLLKMKGDMTQQTYSGEQLLSKDGMATPSSDTSFWNSFATSKITQEIKTKGWARITVGGEAGSGYGNMFVSQSALGLTPGAKYTVIFELANITGSGPASSLNAFDISQPTSNDPWDRDTVQLVTGCLWRGTSNVYIPITPDVDNTVAVFTANTKDTLPTIGLRAFTRPDVAVGTAFDVRATILAGDHSSDWQNYVGDSWQPYVGGIPAPNPDYPQPIRTATGRQAVSVNGTPIEVNLGPGKNLFDEGTTLFNVYINGAGNITSERGNFTSDFIKVGPGQITWGSASQTMRYLFLCTYDSDRNFIARNFNQANIQNRTFTLGENVAYVRVGGSVVGQPSITAEILADLKMQFEVGSEATQYEPYYHIELCKIGGYQDRIYYENGKWWLRKEIGKRLIPAQADIWADRTQFYSCNLALGGVAGQAICSHYRYGGEGTIPSFWTTTNAFRTNDIRASLGDYLSWLGSQEMKILYALGSPTVTEITESSLLSGLNALLALGRFPKNTPPTITVSATSPNLPAVVLTEDLLNDVAKIEAGGITLWQKSE